jgi:hypothetical protein
MVSISSQLGAAGYSWSPSGKDRNGDGGITREEFKMPVMEGFGALVPADLRSAGSLDDAFDSYDRNRDGRIDEREIRAGARPRPHAPDRFRPGWADNLSEAAASAYARRVEDDNAALLAGWGITLRR